MPFQNEWEERQNKCFKAKLDNSDGMPVITELYEYKSYIYMISFH